MAALLIMASEAIQAGPRQGDELEPRIEDSIAAIQHSAMHMPRGAYVYIAYKQESSMPLRQLCYVGLCDRLYDNNERRLNLDVTLPDMSGRWLAV